MGNFEELLKFRARTNNILIQHFTSCAKNATYMSKTIQNGLIDLLAEHALKQVIEAVKAGKYFSILADKVCDASNREHLCICLRYVYEEKCIVE